MFFVFCGIAVVVTKYSFGVHQWNLKLKDLSGFLYVWFWFTNLRGNWREVQWSRYGIIIYPFIIFFIKLAILLQCLRVFVPMKLRNATFWICHGLIWLNLLFYSSIVFVAIFACSPIHKFWNPWIKGRCFNLSTFATVTAAVNTASHFSILVLLQYVIWNMQMSLKKKFGVSTIFLIGILWVREIFSSYMTYEVFRACTASAIRLYYSTKLADGKDVTYRLSIMSLWTIPEMTSGLLAMCLPVSPKFFQALKTSKLRTSFRSLIRRKSKGDLSLGVQPIERKTAEIPAKARSRKHRVLRDEVSASNNDSSEQNLPGEHAMREPSTNQIVRTIQIETSERDAASMPNSGNGAYDVWYDKHHILVKWCSFSFSKEIQGQSISSALETFGFLLSAWKSTWEKVMSGISMLHTLIFCFFFFFWKV